VESMQSAVPRVVVRLNRLGCVHLRKRWKTALI
jgi:hypothetical protein